MVFHGWLLRDDNDLHWLTIPQRLYGAAEAFRCLLSTILRSFRPPTSPASRRKLQEPRRDGSRLGVPYKFCFRNSNWISNKQCRRFSVDFHFLTVAQTSSASSLNASETDK